MAIDLKIEINGNTIRIGSGTTECEPGKHHNRAEAATHGDSEEELPQAQAGPRSKPGGVGGPDPSIGGGPPVEAPLIIGPIVVNGNGYTTGRQNQSGPATHNSSAGLPHSRPGGVGGPDPSVGGGGLPGGGAIVIGPIVILYSGPMYPDVVPADAIKAPIDMQWQQMDHWCWAAVAVSVDRFFSATSPWTQRKLVSAMLNQDCQERPDSCDQPARLDDALRKVGRLAGDPTFPMNFAHLQKKLDDDHKPVCIEIDWEGSGTSHFVAISGYEVTASGTEMVVVEDPFWGRSLVPYSVLRNNYMGAGTWRVVFPI